MSFATSAAASVPTSIVIDLPPGMTPEEYEKLEGSAVTVAISMAVAFAILLWDYLATLPDEIKYYQCGRVIWRNFGTYVFIVLRYSGIIATLSALWLSSVQSDYCQVAASLSESGAILVTMAAGIIFCMRVVVIWSGNKLVYGVVALSYALLVGSWIAVGSQFRATTGAHTPFGSNCTLDAIPAWTPLSWAASFFFDTIVLALVVSKLRAEKTVRSRIGFMLYKDSVAYFTIVTVVNVVVLSINAQGDSFEFVKACIIPFSTVVTYAMGNRVFLNLHLFRKRQQEGEKAALPSASSGNTMLFTTIPVSRPSQMDTVQSFNYASYTGTSSRFTSNQGSRPTNTDSMQSFIDY